MKPSPSVIVILPLLLLLGYAGWRSELWFDDGQAFPFAAGDEMAFVILPDEPAARDLEHVRSRPSAFEPVAGDRYLRGQAGEVLWVRLTLNNPDSRPRAGVLRQFEPYNDEVVLYRRTAAGGWQEAWQGESVPAARSARPGNQCAFPLTLAGGEAATLYLRIRDQQYPDCNLRWDEATRFTDRVAAMTARDSVYFGFLAGLLVSNLFLYMRARQPDRLWYCLALVAVGGFLLIATNRIYSLGWPLAPGARESLMQALLFAASGFLAKVARTSLDLQIHAPRWDRALQVVGWISGALALLAVTAGPAVANEDLHHLALEAGHLLGVVAIGGAIAAWRKGVPMAGSCVLAFSCLLGVFGAGMVFEIVGYHQNELRHFLLEAGSALEMSILWMAVSDRVRRLREDFVRSQQTAVEQTRLNAHKDAMMRLLSHDLRGPLAALDAGLDQVTRAGALDRTLAGRLRAQAQSMRGLVEDLLDRAALEHGRLELNPVRLDLPHLVTEVVAQHADRARHKQQELTFAVPPAPGPAVQGDPARLRQVLANLVDNALKFTPAGGRVHVRLEWTPGGARVEVSDTGPGLQPADFGRLFEPYQPLSAKPTGGEASTGLGLYYAHQIVKLHDGRLVVAARAEGGAVFGFELPAQPPPEDGAR